MAQYVIREHDRGRALREILEDKYVVNRLRSPEQRARLLDRPEIVHAVGGDDRRAGQGDARTELRHRSEAVPAVPGEIEEIVARLGRPAPVAQGIERCPAEAEVASSNLAGRIAASTSRNAPNARSRRGR